LIKDSRLFLTPPFLSPHFHLQSSVGSVLVDQVDFKVNKVNGWCNSIISATLKGLQSLNHPYKYVVTVILMQKNGAGLVSAASTFWDAEKDGMCKVLWENGSMHCVVTVYGTSVDISCDEE
jgi:dynein light chain Tctex-type 1